MSLELGVYSFGATPIAPDGTYGKTSDAVRNVLEAIRLAEQVGLDFYGVGEHHTVGMPISSPLSVLNAAAALTARITLSTAVTVLSTDDPVRVFQQLATAAIVSGDRVEIIAGRGSSTESFPLFGYDLEDYDSLFASKLGLLLATNESELVTWHDRFRDLDEAVIVPRPDRPIKIWLGTGGNPGSVVRAGSAGLPISFGILSGSPSRWSQMTELYREAAARAGHTEGLDVSVATHGFIGRDAKAARDVFYTHESRAYARLGRQSPPREIAEQGYGAGGMVFVGEPEEIAERLIDAHERMGHMRHAIQMDIGSVPQKDVLASIELLGTEVLPRVREALG